MSGTRGLSTSEGGEAGTPNRERGLRPAELRTHGVGEGTKELKSYLPVGVALRVQKFTVENKGLKSYELYHLPV